MRTSNPALSDKSFQQFSTSGGLPSAAITEKMTIAGTVNKSFFLIAIVFISAFVAWFNSYPDGWGIDVAPVIPAWTFPAVLIAFGLSIVIIFKPTTSAYLAPVYAILEGLALGALSSVFEYRYPGIVFQAVLCTFGTFVALLLAYKSRVIRATENFKLGVVAATGGIAIVYLIDLGLRFFGKSVPLIHENGPMGIALSVGIVIVAALNLVLDFDFIERGAEKGAPKFMEWYGAFGLLVTLIWLYLEILRLLAKTRKK